MFKNMKIGERLAVGFSIMLVFIVVLIGVGINSITKIHNTLEEIVNVENVRTELANSMIDNARETALLTRSIIIFKFNNETDDQINILQSKIESIRVTYLDNSGKLKEMIPREETSLSDQFNKIEKSIDSAWIYQDKVHRLANLNKISEATNTMVKKAYPSVQKWIANINEFIAIQGEKTHQRLELAQKQYASIRFFLIIIGLLALVLTTFIAIALTISITRPLKLATTLVLTREVKSDISEYTKGKSELNFMIQSFIKNISERSKMEEEMRVASKYARNLIEASLDPLVTISADGKVTDVNKSTEIVTGVSRERLIGSDFADYFTEPDKAQAGYQQVFSQGKVKDYPLTLRNSSGKTTDVLYNASIYKNEAGEVQGVFAAARDITESKQKDEELKTYRDQLEEMVKTRTNALATILAQVKETVNFLVSSTSEILAATTQVASGSAETASAISETTTTVEEVRQAAQLSSQKAGRVSANSQQIAQVTQTGQMAVEETVTGMHLIKNQMESIAGTIIRLSEQSQQIGGIIASVNDVADQSNLLAVNAAIEAAKAGEQGKGFAVVAQEIKNLALQSKQATIQVRNILSDVQKATSAAVMATEQGSKAVENGVKQSTQAGDSIRQLSQNVNESVQAASQIVASSQQQVVGMDQVSIAMNNINQASAENAASMTQAEKAARDLNELGQKLKHLVEQYKI